MPCRMLKFLSEPAIDVEVSGKVRPTAQGRRCSSGGCGEGFDVGCISKVVDVLFLFYSCCSSCH